MAYPKNKKVFTEKLFKRANGLCFYCQRQMILKPPEKCPEQCTVEHLIPQSKGGKWNMGNCKAACRECNEKRKAMPLSEFVNGKPDPIKPPVRCECETPMLRMSENRNIICLFCHKPWKEKK